MKTITVTELNQRITSRPDLVLFDVRTPAEFDSVHVPGAKNVPLDQFDSRALVDAGRISPFHPVYLLCQTGGRSTKAADKLAQAGIDQAVVVEGGTNAWLEAGLPAERGASKAISIERQVRIGAGSLVLLGVLLAAFVHPYFIALSGFVGAGLLFAGMSDWCGMGLLLARAPWNSH